MAKKLSFKPVYKTKLGKAYCADSLNFMKTLKDDSVDLIITSPPYALHFKKEYGNVAQNQYIDWFLPFAQEIKRIMHPTGSFVLNIGGSWLPGKPERSLYQFKLLIALCDQLKFTFLQEFFWYNPAKMPAPAEWVNVQRIRVKDSIEYIFWLGKTSKPKANNRNILNEYSADMKRLIKKGVVHTKRPSGHIINSSFSENKGGSIPGNLIQCGNNESNSAYIKLSKEKKQKIHPARFPADIPNFFINFLSNEQDLVLDPFAGSNTTGRIAENLSRKWLSVDSNEEYVINSQLRFSPDRPSRNSPNNPGLFEFAT